VYKLRAHHLDAGGHIRVLGVRQLTVLHAALYSLYIAAPGEILEPGWRWRRETYAIPEGWDLPNPMAAAER
jgi:hypothetical protein